GSVRPNLIDPRDYFAREIIQRLRMRRVLAFKYGRLARIACLAKFRIELNRAQKWHPELLGSSLRPATREDVNFVVAMRAHKVAHVLDHADQIDLHLAEHLDRLASVLQRNVRRGGYDDCTRQGNSLNQ